MSAGESDAWKLYVAIYVCYPLAFIGVLFRSYVRCFMKKVMGWDDWLMILSLALYTIYIGFALTGLHYGAGRHASALEEGVFLLAFRYRYFTECSYIITITTIKISIGYFYLRITIPTWQRLVVQCIMWIVALLGLAFFFLIVLQCWPIHINWQRYARTTSGLRGSGGSCLPARVMLGATYAHSVVSAGSDWALALLPIIMLRNIHMPIRVRFVVGAIVACGILASIATLVRISAISVAETMKDFLFTAMAIFVWPTVELGVIIFAACMATLQPLLGRLFPHTSPKLTIRKEPELEVPTNLAGNVSDDLEIGDDYSKNSEPEAKKNPRTIEIPWDSRDVDGNLECVDATRTVIRGAAGGRSGLGFRELGFEIDYYPHNSLRSSEYLPPAINCMRLSGDTMDSETLEVEMEDYMHERVQSQLIAHTIWINEREGVSLGLGCHNPPVPNDCR